MFFGAFSKIRNKITFMIYVFIVFEAESEPTETGRQIFWFFFLQIPKALFFGGKNKVIFKLKFQTCIFAFVFYCKRKLRANFHKKILIFEPPGFFCKRKLGRVWSDAGGNFGFGLLKSCLTLGYSTCTVRSKKFHTPPYSPQSWQE